MKNNINEIQDKLLISAKEILKIFKKHKIDYFVTGGTLLGAIRNNGFIPWDDDFDFAIFETDKDKVINALRKELPKKYNVFVQDYNNDSFSSPIKILLEDTFSIETNKKFYKNQQEKYEPKIFIDIFTLSKGIENKFLAEIFRHYFIFSRFHQFDRNLFTFKGISDVISNIIFKITLPFSYLLLMFEKPVYNIYNKITRKSSIYIFSPLFWRLGKLRRIKITDRNDFIVSKFEDVELRVFSEAIKFIEREIGPNWKKEINNGFKHYDAIYFGDKTEKSQLRRFKDIQNIYIDDKTIKIFSKNSKSSNIVFGPTFDGYSENLYLHNYDCTNLIEFLFEDESLVSSSIKFGGWEKYKNIKYRIKKYSNKIRIEIKNEKHMYNN